MDGREFFELIGQKLYVFIKNIIYIYNIVCLEKSFILIIIENCN